MLKKRNIYLKVLLIVLAFLTGMPALPQQTFASEKSLFAAVSVKEEKKKKKKEDTTAASENNGKEQTGEITQDGEYLSKEAVALYLHYFGHLPDNYLTRSAAEKKGWNADKENLWEVAPGAAIGGNKFGNREGLLPSKKNRQYYECDVDSEGGGRSDRRLVYSDDGLIFYTEDLFESFEQLIDGPDDTEGEAALREALGLEENENGSGKEESENSASVSVEEDGFYTTKEEVALYLHLFGHLPDNYITKNEAESLGWVSNKGNLWKVAPGMSIGGSRFGNYEGQLPEKKGRKYYECDIDFDGTYRNGKRIVFSNDGLIYYTDDHYESFELLYGEE